MKYLAQEVESNFKTFSARWPQELETSKKALDAFESKFHESYARLVSLQAFRSELLEQAISTESQAFFLEAQNDALISHVLARLGTWRSALKSLRSCIENAVACLYYMDHPVELTLWHEGKHRLGFAPGCDYLAHHPNIEPHERQLHALETLTAEYGTLSRAVHASAPSFRMTGDASGTLLWIADRAQLGAWSTREAHVLTGINLLLLTMFRERLQGASLIGLRKAVSLAVPESRHALVKTQLGIRLFKPV